jgi:protein KTI12
MALVVLSGQPCSGKSTAAAALRQLLQARGLDVILIDEPGLGMARNESYKGEVCQALQALS